MRGETNLVTTEQAVERHLQLLLTLNFDAVAAALAADRVNAGPLLEAKEILARNRTAVAAAQGEQAVRVATGDWAGRWGWHVMASGHLVLTGSLFRPTQRVYLFARGEIVRVINTMPPVAGSDHAGHFRFKLHPTLLKHFPFETRFGIGSDQGALRHDDSAKPFGLFVQDLGVGDIFQRIHRGQFISKKGKLASDLRNDRGWQRRALHGYQFMRDYMKRKFAIDLYLIYGTLLGLWREHDFISTDDDLDTSYLSRETSPEGVRDEMVAILLAMQADGIKFKLAYRKGFFKPQINGFRFDVFPAWIDAGRLWMHNTTALPADRSLIEPLRSATFKDQDVLIPNQPEEFLRLKYGDGWDRPDPGYTPVATWGTLRYLARASLREEDLARLGAPPAGAVA